MDFKNLLLNENVKPYILKARYGIEKESQRVNLLGRLSKTEHPKNISIIDEHPYIQKDFSETQIELITPVTDSLVELFNYLEAIQNVAYNSIGSNEMLWPLSMPPMLPENDDDIVIAKLKKIEDVQYRQYLSNTYGRRKQMISGVHFNFEFGDELIQKLFSLQWEIKDYKTFKTEVYLKVTRNYLHYRWLITYFYGASPNSEKNFFEETFPYRGRIPKMRISHVKSIFPSDTNGLSGFENFVKSILFMQFGFA